MQCKVHPGGGGKTGHPGPAAGLPGCPGPAAGRLEINIQTLPVNTIVLNGHRTRKKRTQKKKRKKRTQKNLFLLGHIRC